MNRADVVEVVWSYTDMSGSKIRPAVVVQADFLNGILDDTILVKVTGSKYGIPGTEVRIDPAGETSSGLNKVCYVSCKDILTRDQTHVLRTIGVLSDAAIQEIEACLKTVMKLP